jgi:hypothetical protein
MKTSFSKEKVLTPSPVEGVVVESVNTAGPVGPVGTVGPVGDIGQGPVIDVQSEIVAPAAEIPASPVTTTNLSVAVVVPPAPLAVVDTPIIFDDNDIKFEDVYLPRVNIVQNVGDLMKIFESGDIVLNGSYSIHSPSNPPKRPQGNPPLNVTVVGFRKKQFAEKIAGKGGGLLVNSEAEVAKNGGTLSYGEWKQSVDANKADPSVKTLRRFEPYATALVIIERPAHLKDEGNIQFPYECEGKFYTLALWGMKGTAYTGAAKHFFTARKLGHLKKGYMVRSWSLTTKLESYESGNTAWVPAVTPSHENSAAFLAFVREAAGVGN